MNKKRKLTLEVEIIQPDGDWIWEEHISGKMHRGIYIRTIAEGHLVTEPEKNEDKIQEGYFYKKVEDHKASGGCWSEYPGCPREDWKYEVAEGNTNCGYWEWVELNLVLKRDGE